MEICIHSRVVLWHSPTEHDNEDSNSVTIIEHKLKFELSVDTKYLALPGMLYSVHCEYLSENCMIAL